MTRRALDELKQQIPLLEYLQAHDWRQARPIGFGRFLGLCPLHADHEPSFLVDPNKNLFHCYGCRRGGDIIRFVELYHQVKFPEAVALLHQWRGLPPLLHEAAGFYRMQLHRHAEAVAYLCQRGICSPEVIEHMRIGYAPGGCLRGWLTQLGYPVQALRQAGLVTAAGYDTYKHRVVFPLEGNLYGRSLSAAAPPHRFLPGVKGGLYSWDQTRLYPEVILVEGLFDYAALWQAGFHNVTCSMGANLNARQFRQLCDGPRTIYLAFDALAASTSTGVPERSDQGRQSSQERELTGATINQFQRAIDSLTAALAPASVRQYRAVARCFLIYLGEQYPAVGSLHQLRRDPHVIGWFVDLRSQNLAPAVYIARLLLMRCMLEELAWSAQVPNLAHLIRREDIPRAPHRLPRALTPQQDPSIQQELLRRNDLPSNVLLLMRHTGMRIGECVDLAYDCLHNAGPDRWAIHVPLGKLKTERMVPVDSFVCELVHRLRFFRSFDPLPFDGRLLARPRHKQTLVKQLRSYLPDVVAAVGIPTRIVPHQLRHTYASEMVRAGVGLPALMKLLGHVNPEMTMRYVDVAGADLQREFHLARSQPRHLTPQPKAPNFSPRGGLDGVIDSLLFAQHAIEMFRRSLPNGTSKRRLDQLANRLTKVLAETRKLKPDA